ncbi:MAG: hypothetical protein HQK51_17685 [Oligoflexia bacterium]|nr:hypothetical protein [Oligoflexia bacterium]
MDHTNIKTKTKIEIKTTSIVALIFLLLMMTDSVKAQLSTVVREGPCDPNEPITNFDLNKIF